MSSVSHAQVLRSPFKARTGVTRIQPFSRSNIHRETGKHARAKSVTRRPSKMRLSTSYNPHSHHYQAFTLSDRLAHLRQNGVPRQAVGTTFRRSAHFYPPSMSRMDMIDVLGGFDAMAGPHETTIGHTGCVNALAWSQSGDYLASGSDDRRVILWKMGATDEAPSIEFPITGAPQLGLAQSEVIETGHRANIFSVKWAPNSGDRRLFTCAGDSQMRVFDLTRASAYDERKMSSGKEYKVWQQDQGACTRVLRCHSSRAKRISTENSPDVFLSCAEDGDVRQTDLRVPHTCARSRGYGEGCPRPLVQFKMELYSLSVSKQEPWLFAVAGTSDKVFLMDRRMVPRLLKREWGSTVPSETAALAHCVRLFERVPADEDQHESDDGTQTTAQAAAALVRRRRQARAHVTAVKISEHNGRDMLASYSGDDVYKFDIHRAPGLRKTVSKTLSMETETNKRLRRSYESPSPAPTVTTEDERVVAARKRITSSLFDRPPSRRAHLLRRQQILEDLQVVYQAARDQETRFCVALCKLLLSLSDGSYNAAEDGTTADITRQRIDESRQELTAFQDRTIAQGIFSLLAEYTQADDWGAMREIAKIRNALFACSEEIIRQQWPEAATTTGGADDHGLDEDMATNSESDDMVWPGNEVSQEEVLDTLQELADEESEDMDEDDEEEHEDDDDEHGDGFADGHDAHELFTGHLYDTEETGDESDDDESGDDNVQRHELSGGNDAPRAYPVSSFTGHVNVETVKDCGFVGSNDEYVWSGSDCGHLFIWRNGQRSELCGIWKADDSVVNVLAQHPTLPVCAVSGIDDTVKILGPRNLQTNQDLRYDRLSDREEIMRRNAARRDVGEPSLGSRSLMRLFARRAAQGGLEHMTIDGEEQDCVIA